MEKNITESKQKRIEEEFDKFKKILDIDDLNEVSDFFPRYVQIETTRMCNARCPFCPQDEWDKSTPFMSDDLFEKIVDELKDYTDWVRWVCVQKAGEPLLDKKIVEKIKILKDVGIRHVMMSTNASLLNENKSIELINAGLGEIMFSIDSVIPEEYTKMRVGLDYETVVNNIRSFVKLRDELNPDLLVRVRGISFLDAETNEGRRHLESWESFWADLRKPNDRIYMKKAHNWGNQKEWDGHSPGSYGTFYHPCIIPWSTMTISAMGIVGLCVQDYDSKMNLGDINRQSISEVWKSKAYNDVRKLHFSGDRNNISFCDGCIVFDQDHSLEKK